MAMSGGVDSSATAALLLEQGWDVIGVTMQLYDHGKAICRANSCCAGKDIHDARRVADALGIPHYVVDFEQRFKEDVIDPFVASYVAGETPIPCIACNQTVKFRDLISLARELGAEALATGHYVRRDEGPDGAIMRRPVDLGRDQSYFLFATTKEQLEFLRFPLGEIETKEKTREIARRFSLPVASKPDSQDICFAPDGDYASVVAAHCPDALRPGDIEHVDGRILASHSGLIHFTIGQRKGLGIGGFPEPIYVTKLDAANNRVIVGPRAELQVSTIYLRDVNWLGAGDFADQNGTRLAVKVRSTRGLAPACLFAGENNTARIEMDQPEEGVAPGQACVFYDGDVVLGGGWITAKASS